MINRIDCYKVLFDMKKNGQDVDKQLTALSTSTTVPTSVIEFINNNRPLVIREFYEELRKQSNSKNNKLYKNLVKETHENILEASKTLSSLLTRIIIKAESLDKENILTFYKQARVSKITTALNEYFSKNNVESIIDELTYIRNDIKILEGK